MRLDPSVILAVFGGGVFGAAIGALPAFIFTGVMVLVGVAVSVAAGKPVVLDAVAFGPYFSPNISFAAGVAAAAYAGRIGALPSGADIKTPLIKTKSFTVLLVGGLFGVIGHLITTALNLWKFPSDNIALTVVLSGCIARLAFGKTGLFGKGDVPKRILPAAESLGANLLLCASLGFLSAYASAATGSPVVGFGISAASLMFAQMGFEMPVTHHVTLPAAVAAAAFGGNFWMGALFGALGYLVGDIGGNLLNKNVDSHIDPPAFAICILTLVVLLIT
ncbi:MAG: hypothetical protein NUV93_02165 [Firmicutes bacterium]|nr:hypothetical protein [Bacillota bacterium]